MWNQAIIHRWDLSPKEAIALQWELAGRVRREDDQGRWRTVAGVDVGVRHGVARAAVVVLTYPALQEVARAVAEAPVAFPYVPGLLSFREAPVALAALAQLETLPDVLIFDGQGYAHPRRLGIASHVGVLLDWPTVGCAKSRLCGQHREPGVAVGSQMPLMDGDECIGAVLRTRWAVRPVYVSVGHRVSLESAVALVLACSVGYRLPEPIRRAHRLASGPASITSPPALSEPQTNGETDVIPR